METTTYSIKPRPAVRAFAVAAVLALAGAGLAVAANALAWHGAVVVVGVLLVVAALALIVAAVRAPASQEVRVEFDADGFRIVGPTDTHEGAWGDVTRVTEAPGRLTFHLGADKRFHVVGAHATDQLRAMASDIAQRLDDNRGYRPLV